MKIKHIYLFIKGVLMLFSLSFSGLLNAQDPPPPDGLSGQELRDWLKQNWYDPFHSSVGYNAARQEMYSDIDNENGNVFCVYSGFNQAAAFTTYLNPINAEHTVPQVLFNSNEPMRSDVHHVFPTHQDVNSARGSMPFGESQDSSTDNWYIGDSSGLFNINSIPNSDIDDYSERDIGDVFEPREDHKGDVARAVFYFYTMYPDIVGNISEVGDINTLHQWHLNDLPDAKEIERNDKIQALQGNFNPYINMPELLSIAWGLPSSVDQIDEYKLKVFPNPVTELLQIESTLEINKINIYSMDGSLIQSSNENVLDMQNVDKGLYILELITKSQTRIRKRIVKL